MKNNRNLMAACIIGLLLLLAAAVLLKSRCRKVPTGDRSPIDI